MPNIGIPNYWKAGFGMTYDHTIKHVLGATVPENSTFVSTQPHSAYNLLNQIKPTHPYLMHFLSYAYSSAGLPTKPLQLLVPLTLPPNMNPLPEQVPAPIPAPPTRAHHSTSPTSRANRIMRVLLRLTAGRPAWLQLPPQHLPSVLRSWRSWWT